MVNRKNFLQLGIAIILLFPSLLICNDKSNTISTSGSKAAVFKDIQGNVNITYYEPNVGKKVVVRHIYLLPSYLFTDKNSGFYDNVEIALEIQNITSEPLLITAINIDIVNSKNIKQQGVTSGTNYIADRIAKNKDLLFLRPAENKIIGLSKHFVLNKINEFFKSDIFLNQINLMPYRNMYVPTESRYINLLNRFMSDNYGKNASFKLIIYEKDYRPIFDSKIKLNNGGTLFDSNDLNDSQGIIQYDIFIGEVLNMIQNKDANEKDIHSRFFND